MSEYDPNIIAFLCNWCAYAGADLAGTSRLKYPSNVKAIRIMCSGRVDPVFILEALREGADGILVAGCHPGDCHYQSGNYKTSRKIRLLWRLLRELNMDPERVRFEHISASEGQKFADVVTDFVYLKKVMGPNPMTGECQ
ncbi:MAG: methyl-viologen-reducing hydrogenase subunit delta [Thermoplasmata archaeon]|nr:MAG: methyl-viologen-reducing hydrogenase subunit delta [Thermoplasmata archaeon]